MGRGNELKVVVKFDAQHEGAKVTQVFVRQSKNKSGSTSYHRATGNIFQRVRSLRIATPHATSTKSLKPARRAPSVPESGPDRSYNPRPAFIMDNFQVVQEEISRSPLSNAAHANMSESRHPLLEFLTGAPQASNAKPSVESKSGPPCPGP